MIYGDWELTEGCYYYKSQNIIVFPTSNSVDRGKLTVEENMREIVTRITNLNYALSKDDFKLIINRNPEGVPDTITVNPGKANLLGYCVYTNSKINIPIPSDKDDTHPETWYTLGMSLAMDGSDHVCGDVLNKDGTNSSENEMYSGAYLRFYKDCEIKKCWKRILILGRVKIKDQKVIEPAEGNDCEDPFKDHRIDGDEVDMRIIGRSLRNLDTYDINITNVENYETALHSIDNKTKPPTFTTDVQDYSRLIPDWYVSKYGDYMTGALTMRYYSEDQDKSSLDGIIISPRRLGKLTSQNDISTADVGIGGTIMSVVPNSYSAGLDSNSGHIGTHSALVSSAGGDTGLDINALDGSLSRLVHDIGGGNLLIENTAGIADENGRTLSHIRFDHGQMFAYSDGNGIQLYSRDSSGNVNNIDMRIDQYKVTISENDTIDYHGQHSADKVHHTLGLGITNGIDTALGYVHNTDAYYLMDNLRLRSNTWSGRSTKLNTIESVDPRDLKYIRVLPRTMTGQVLAEERLQVGVGKANDVVRDEANGCNNRISIVSSLSAGKTQSTYIEQMLNGQVYNRIDHDSSKVDGIYSYRNIGSSSDRSNGNPWNSSSNYVRIDNSSIILHGIGNQSNVSKNKISFGCDTSNDDVTLEYFYDHSRSDYTDKSHGYLKLTGGLDITGDINYWGNSTSWGRVFNAVYNDYAEWYKKSDESDTFEAGDVISLLDDGKYGRSSEKDDRMVVGVCSDSYGYITGGDKLINMSDNEKNYIPVGISGRLRVKCITDANPGDLLVSSNIPGKAMVNNEAKPGTIIGKALSNNNDGYVMIQIMLS